MEQENDAQLVREVLSGDDEAFNILLQRYQRGIHALVWRKIGDFHHAEEITQDTFLRAYEKLSTLKEPSQFAGWLYVIANRLCINWLQRRKPTMQSLENTPVKEIEKSSYDHYISDEREAKASEDRHELVKKILEKLPESDRTVITLYYLGDMTTQEIGRLLGVSVNTITSRLQRARRRLQEDEELMVQEVFSGVQVPANLSQNVMRRVADMNPTPPPPTKPLLPWAAFGTALVLVVLFLGTSNQYLTRFQKPYSFEAQSEPTIEIIDVPVVLTTEAKPAVRNQDGQAALPTENSGIGLQTPENIFAPNTQTGPFTPSTSPWTQASGPQGSHVSNLFATPQNTLYATTGTGIYRLAPEAPQWTLINTRVLTGSFSTPMAAHGGSLYIVSRDEVFASGDEGKVWAALGPRPEGDAVALIVTDAPQSANAQADPVMYLALRDKGVFRSTDAGRQWTRLDGGLADKQIYALAAIGRTVFAGTNQGLYRLNADVWEQLSVGTSSAVQALAVFKNHLYVGMGADLFSLKPLDSNAKRVEQIALGNTTRASRIFHSSDLGTSWTEITPKNGSRFVRAPTGIRLLVTGETLLAQGINTFRSRDNGRTWENLGFDRNSFVLSSLPLVGIGENTFYRAGTFGIQRTTDGGISWHPFMNGIVGTNIRDWVVFNNMLYARTGNNLGVSSDNGETWKSVRIDVTQDTPGSVAREPLDINLSYDSKLVVAAGEFYGILPEKNNLRFLRLHKNDNVLRPVYGIPSFSQETLSPELVTAIAEAERIDLADDMKSNAQLAKPLRDIVVYARAGGFAVSGETFYVEYKRMLFKWRPGETQWTHTGLIDLGKQPTADLQDEFKVAASGEIVYVGKRDGKLFQSLDAGSSWKDITASLPLHFTRFNEVRFVGATVYVATDAGVLSSHTGEHWRVLANGPGTRVVIDRFAVDNAILYGAGDTGVYRLDTPGRWHRIFPNIPDKVLAFAVGNGRLYIVTRGREVFQSPLPVEDAHEISHR